jgi:hypothetical protein
MILYGWVKQCMCKKILKIWGFTWGRGDFISFLVIVQPNDPLQKKKSKSKHALETNLYTLQKGMIIKGIL